MSFFDQRYYAMNKGHMSRIGIWPEQSTYVRNIRPVAIIGIILSLVCVQVASVKLIRLRDVRADLDAVINCLPVLLCIVMNIITVSNSILKSGKMKVMLKKMEAHWKIVKNTSAVIVLDKYAERGRFLTTVYTMYLYTLLAFFLFIPLVPMILDFVDPLNETRPKDFIYDAEYGVDQHKYFWPILAHGYIVSILGVFIFIAIDTMYIMWIEHACALFEIVGFKLKMTTAEYMTATKNAITNRNNYNYQNICDCVILHKEAISFAGMIESTYSESLVGVMGLSTIVMSITCLQAVINMENPEISLRAASFLIGQACHLWFNNIPGQKLIDHSLRVHNLTYDFDWYNMPLKTQKLLILMLMRSKTPCLLTAGKVYVLSMENYGSVMKTALQYFVIFLQLY